MILSLLLTVLGIVIVAGAVLLFSPFRVKVTFETSGLHAGGGGVFSFLHPALVSVTFNIAERSYILKVLGRQLGKKKKTPDTVPPVPSPVVDTGGASPIPEFPKVTAETPHLPQDEAGSPSTEPVSENDAEEIPAEEGTQNQFQQEPPRTVEESVPPENTVTTVYAPSADLPTQHTAPPPKADISPVKENAAEPEVEEKVVPQPKKRDNWFRRLERNRYLFFIRNAKWRTKIFKWLFRVVRTFFRIVRFDHFNVAVRAGVSDPVITGTLTGFYQAALYGLPMKRPPVLSFEPVFMRNHFESKGSIRVSTSLSQLLLPVGVAVVTFPVLHTLWLVWLVYRRERRYKKESVA